MDKVTLSGYAGRVGDTILVRAHDDFQVAGVAAALTTSRAEGNAIDAERGAAAAMTPADGGRWTLRARRHGPCAARRDDGADRGDGAVA